MVMTNAWSNRERLVLADRRRPDVRSPTSTRCDDRSDGDAVHTDRGGSRPLSARLDLPAGMLDEKQNSALLAEAEILRGRLP
jgi:hypothetical protein